MDVKKKVLDAVYGVYSSWAGRFPLACKKGCAACCTGSVTMTSLEGEVILDFVERNGRQKWLQEKLTQVVPRQSKAAITTNQFAEACLNHWEVGAGAMGCWDFTPCVFLEDASCSIYETRPFGCRSFGSLVQCAAETAAEIAPIHLTINTVFTQIIEHINSDGGHWSTMIDILQSLGHNRTGKGEIHLLPACPVPGFLLERHEVQVVKGLLHQIRGDSSEKRFFSDLIDNLMPI